MFTTAKDSIKICHMSAVGSTNHSVKNNKKVSFATIYTICVQGVELKMIDAVSTTKNLITSCIANRMCWI